MKKNILLAILIPVMAGLSAFAGDITPGSVPGSLNYQGRLERDNAPITGPIHLTFRIYNAPSGGTVLYAAPEMVVNAAQGIFSASITPPWTTFSNAGTLFLEVQVESDILSPREPLSSVAYAMVARKLEDGATIKVATLTTSGSVGIGTDSPTQRLTVNGTIQLLGATDKLCFYNGACMESPTAAVVPGGLTAPVDSLIESGTQGPLFIGPLTFNTSTVQRMRITDSTQFGRIGIGAAAIANPLGTLDVDGSLYVGAAGIYNRAGGSVTVSGLYIPDGGLTGKDSEAILIGQTSDVISFISGGSEKMRVHSNGNVGIGTTAPALNTKLSVAGDILSNTGMRAGDVSVGGYTGGALANEIRTQAGSPLLLQQTNSYNVGIGTNTPVEKLHVRGSIKAEMGIIAATAAFSDSVRVDSAGNFTANSGHNMVYLSSTVIYGTLLVTGGVGSALGLPAYLTSTQTFSGQNTFANQVTVSSDIITINRVGVGARGFNFAPSRYLQIGDKDNGFPNDDAAAYVVGGDNANSKVYFYRGAAEAARFETQSGANLALVIGNAATKSLVDSTYYRIYNSVFWVSTGTNNTTPAVYVSSSLGNVGMGTAILDPNHRLTVEGNIRISTSSSPGQSYGIIFADGTALNSASAGGLTFGGVSNNANAVVTADADSNGSGSVILRTSSLDALVVNSGGNVGIGTLYPNGKLNVRGGDLVLGTPSLLSGGSSAEDLFIAGNIVVDGGIVQRSNTQVQLSALKVAGDVYLSTGATARTRIGSDTAPAFDLDVTGDINASGAIWTNGISRLSAAGVVGSGNANASWDGVTIPINRGGTGATSWTQYGIVYAPTTNSLGQLGLGTANQLLHGNAGGAATWAQVDLTADVTGTLPVGKGGTGQTTFTSNGVLYGNAATNVSVTAAGSQYQTLQAGGGGTPVFGALNLNQAAAVAGVLPSLNGGTGANLSAGAVGAVPYFSAAGVMSAALGAGPANYLLQGNGAGAAPGWVESTPANAGNTVVRRDVNGDFSANTITANSFSGAISGYANYIYAQVSSNDYALVRGINLGGSNNGALEIATADDGTEPIYARQYTGVFTTLVRTATLLDAAGNTSFPGTVSAPWFSGSLSGSITGNADTVDNAHVDTAYNNFGAGTIPKRNASGYLYSNWFNMVANVNATNPEYLVGEWAADGFLRYVTPANVSVGYATNAGNAATTTNGLTTGSAFGGDVSGTYDNIAVLNNSHTHDTTTISALDTSDITTGTLGLARGGTGGSSQSAAQVSLNVPDKGTAAVGKVVCLKAGGTSLGYCINIDTTTGNCTCQ